MNIINYIGEKVMNIISYIGEKVINIPKEDIQCQGL